MFITDLIFIFMITAILTLVFAVGFRRQSWGAGLLLFFLILFLTTWAGSVWVTPFGPLWLGVPWVSILLVGILVALLLAALTPKPRGQALPETMSETRTLVALDVFFWILIAGLAIAIIARYIVR